MAQFDSTNVIFVTEYGETPASQKDVIIVNNTILTIDIENLPQLSSPGLLFEGWYSSSSFEEDTKVYSTTIPAFGGNGTAVPGGVKNGVVTLYAKWSWIDMFVLDSYIIRISDQIRRIKGDNIKRTPEEITQVINELQSLEGGEF